jgi:hypothetical protein
VLGAHMVEYVSTRRQGTRNKQFFKDFA